MNLWIATYANMYDFQQLTTRKGLTCYSAAAGKAFSWNGSLCNDILREQEDKKCLMTCLGRRGANPDDSALKVAVKFAQAAGQLFVTAAGEHSSSAV